VRRVWGQSGGRVDESGRGRQKIGYNPKFYSFAKFDPDYVAGGDQAEGGEDGPDDLQLSEADMDALTAMRESVDSAAAGAMLDDDGGEG